MSLAVIYCPAAIGVQAPLGTIEVHLSNGLPFFGHKKHIPKKGNASLTRMTAFPIMGKCK